MMANRRLAPPEQQPKEFSFTAENARVGRNGRSRNYPEGRQQSAIIPLLWRAQEQHGGWLPEAAIRHVADMLGHGAHPRARGRDLLHHVPARAGGQEGARPGLRHHALHAARRAGDLRRLPQAHPS